MTIEQTTSQSWELAAPESLVLRDGPGAARMQAVKLGLLELLTRGSLRLVDIPGRDWRGRDRAEKVLVRGAQPLPDTGVLAPIARAFYNTAEKQFANGVSGRSIKEVARTFATSQRTRGGTYVSDIILPELAARGLFVRRLDHVLGIFPRTRWFRTSHGDRRRAELLTLLTDGERELSGRASRDPRDAATVLATAGAAALLMTAAYPKLADLSRRLRQEASGDGGTVAAGGVIYSDSPDEAPSGPEPTFPEPSLASRRIPAHLTSRRRRSSTSTCPPSTGSTPPSMRSTRALTRVEETVAAMAVGTEGEAATNRRANPDQPRNPSAFLTARWRPPPTASRAAGRSLR